jgi:NADPH-dependent ferric siderophore reductase
MASFQARVRDTFSRLVFPEMSVDSVRDVSPHFRLVRVSGAGLQHASVSPGDKLQIMILEAGPRTYSPFAHDPGAGTVELLMYVHGSTAANDWIRSVSPGVRFRAFGPRGSLALSSLTGPIVFFGDETSFGVAASLVRARVAQDGLSFVFECSQPDEARDVLSELGISRFELVARRSDRSHAAAVDGGIRAALSRQAGSHLVLTGHAQMIQSLRASLKASPAPHAGQKVKAYWADGKRGLD